MMVSRRRVLGLGLSLGALAGCSAPDGGSAPGWSFVDDRGVRATSGAVPRRIIAQVSAAGALNDFGVPVVGTFGPLVRDDGSTEPEAGSIDPRRVIDVTGPGYGELDMERTAALRPDLLVSGKYAEFEGLWHLTVEQERQARSIAATVGIEQSGRSLPETIGAYRELARALGSDVDSERMRADEARFHAAAQRLRRIGARMREQHRSILAIGGTKQEFFVVVPARNPDLDYYVRELGLPIQAPARPDTGGGGYFERLSWENAGSYRGDVLMWDTRPASLPPSEMKRNPVFAAQEAAAHDRFVEWHAVAPCSYASYAGIMTGLADQLEAAAPG
ncbi:ABC transporter substrate-binding protein [Saccharopolyspora sp. SCSIO 74807]|uniref:ABC transporter substrate-binding protein n=1 Tax=Saccharopolyspora sp. SCSIO 74807 TaxID=3118084 RepID=UPI0030D32E81